MVAWELVQLAWSEDGENWMDESLDGNEFSLPEPTDGEVWDRQRYNLPSEGVLRLRFQSTRRRPKMAQVVDRRLLRVLVSMMDEPSVFDKGLQLLSMAAQELRFAAQDAAALLDRFTDAAARVQAAAIMLPRIVDAVNINGLLYEKVCHYMTQPLVELYGGCILVLKVS
jgi:hypothetical protein